MDTAPKQFIALGKKLLNELAVINQHLSKLLQFQPQAKTQPSPDQNEEQGKKKSAHRRVHIDEMVPIDLAQDIKDEYKTANNQTTTNNNKQLFWARVSAGLIFIYAGVTFLMYLANRDAANAALGANVVTQAANRAYIGFQGINTTHVTYRTKTGDESHMWFTATLQNGGNTPANATNYFRVDPLPMEPNENEFQGELKAAHPSNVAQPHSTVVLGTERKTTYTLFGKDVYAVPRQQIRTTNNIPNIFAWGWLAYRDAFPGSAPHLTEFCNRMESVRLRPTGELEISWTLCNSHNCVDKSCKDYDDLAKFAPEL